jgi:hypothetical protein
VLRLSFLAMLSSRSIHEVKSGGIGITRVDAGSASTASANARLNACPSTT